MLAETVSIDGGALVLILIVLLLTLAVAAAVVIAGFVFAYRAGKGSHNALVGWMVVAGMELLVLLLAVLALFQGNGGRGFVVPTLALLGQAGVFLRAKRQGPPDA